MNKQSSQNLVHFTSLQYLAMTDEALALALRFLTTSLLKKERSLPLLP